jgi:restriction system protein
VAELIERLGFENVTVTPRSGDGGQDILATKFFNDIPMLFSFECKRYSKSNKIKPEIMRALFGTVSASNSKANKGVLVTTSTFSPGAKSFIASEPLIDGKDFYDLVKWINQVKK